jgi:hypothetical protein
LWVEEDFSMLHTISRRDREVLPTQHFKIILGNDCVQGTIVVTQEVIEVREMPVAFRESFDGFVAWVNGGRRQRYVVLGGESEC